MTSLYAYALLVWGVVLGLAIAGVAYHVGFFIRDIRDRLQALTMRVDAIDLEQADETPDIVEAISPKEEKLHKFDPEDNESAIVDALTPKEIAQRKHKQMLKEIEEADNA